MKLDKNTFFLLSGFSLKILVQFLNIYLISLYINKIDYSEYNYCLIFVNIYLVFSIGLVDGLNIEIPYLRLKESEKVAAAISSSYTYFIGLFIITFIASLVGYRYIDISIMGSIFIVFMCILSISEYFLISVHRGLDKVKIINIANLIFSILQVVTIVIIIQYGLKGLYIKMLLSQGLYVAYMYYYFSPKIKFQFDKDLLKKIIQIGFPLYAFHYTYILGISLDKIIIVNFFDKKQLGIYSYGTVVYMFYLTMYKVLSSYYYPQFIGYLAELNVKKLIKKYIHYTLFSFIISSFIAFVIYFLSDFIFKMFLMNYIESLGIFKNFSLVGPFLISNFTSYTLITSYKNKKFTYLYNLILILPIYLCPIICYFYFDFNLLNLSYSILISNIIMFSFTQLFVYYFFTKIESKDSLKY